MSNQTNPSKQTSIMDMFKEGPSSEELYGLKEFLDLLRQEFDIKIDDSERLVKRKNSDTKLDESYINSHVHKLFETCLDRVPATSNTQLANRKSDLAHKILENLALYSDQINDFDSVTPNIVKTLDKLYFDKLIKVFQSSSPEFALKMVKVIIEILGKSLHNNLSIINPLLQIMEFAFKHSNNSIKSQSYECWQSLIKNFALDRDFFLKPKKFALILMPLLNKCKTFKEENVCRAKVLAWMCLIENLSDQLPKYTNKVLIPFFNYCFGLNGFMIENGLFNEGEEDESDRDEKIKKFLTSKIQPEHDFKSLIQIGSELLISLFFNGESNEDFRKLLTHVNPSLNFGRPELLNDKHTWLFLMKYFFEIVMTHKPNQSNEGGLLIEGWKQLGKLFGLDLKTDLVEDEDEEMIMDSQFTNSKESSPKTEWSKEYTDFYVTNSVDFVNNFVVSSKYVDCKFVSQMGKLVLSHVKNEYGEHYVDKSEMKVNLIKLMKKCSNLMLSTDEENTNVYLSNLGFLINLMDKNHDLIDLYQWIHLTTKFYDHLKSIKTKTNQIQLSEQNYNLVSHCILFPFVYYKNLDILESDIKLILSSCSNISKLFSSIIKQNRVKLFSTNDDLTINNWSTQFFQHLIRQYKKSTDSSFVYELNHYWTNLNESTHNAQSQPTQQPTTYLIENTLKILQLQTQFTLNILQNVFEFDSFNELSNSQSNEPLGVFLKKTQVNFPTDLIEFIKLQIKLFHKFIKSQTNPTSAKLNEDETDEFKTTQSLEVVDTKTDKDSKLPVQILISLIEELSCLFTRVKNNSVLNDLLINFSDSIEVLAELNSISKMTSDTPKTQSSHSHINSHFKYSTERAWVQFCSNRKSSELFDTFSLQVSSLIQNNVSKIYPTNEYDSSLLEKFEPIFYSFLSYTTKQALKQKTLQAWNSTFGKSSVQLLKYTRRLEDLFVEIKEEMIQKKASSNLVLSLPGFKPIDLMNSNTNNTTNSTFIVQEPENDEKENTPENLKTESNSSIGIAHFVFSPAAGRNSFFKQQQSASASKATPEKKIPKPSPRSLKHNSKRKLDLNGLIDQQPDGDFVEIVKPELKSRRSLTLRSKQPLTEHQKEVRKTRSFIPMEVQSIDVDSQMSCTVDEDTSTQPEVHQAEKMSDETVKAIFQYKRLEEPVLQFQSKMNPEKKIEVIEVKTPEEESEEEGKRRSIRLKQKEEIEDEVSKIGDNLIQKLETEHKKRSNLELLKMKNNLLKRSKKIASFKPKNSKVARRNLERYKNLIMKTTTNDDATKKSEKTKKKLEKRQKIKELNASLNEEDQENEVEEVQKVVEDVSMHVEADTDDDDDKPLSILIEKKKEVVPDTPEIEPEVKPEIVQEEPVVTVQSVLETPGKLEPVIEDEVTESTKPTKKTTEDLILKLNSTPTTSILKKRLNQSKLMNQSDNLITIDMDTPGKRRVSFCESVQVEEIEPNFNKSIFNRSTPRVQNKAKIVLSPYFGNKNPASPCVSSPSPVTTAPTVPSVPEVPTTPNSKTPPPNVTNSPGSASFLEFFSTNRIMSQRSSMIQQQMQSKTDSPKQSIGLSTSLPLPQNFNDSPKPLYRTITQMELVNDYKVPDKMKSSKLSIEILFDQIDTSLYMQKLGSYKYFKYKNILTIGDFSSLKENEINNLPLKVPKQENYVSLLKTFEEKCADMLNKEDKKLVSMGSVEEEMEKLEKMENLTNLDTSIECVGDKPKMEVDESKQEIVESVDLGKIVDKFEDEMKSINGTIGSLSTQELFDLSRQFDRNRLRLAELFNSKQEMIRKLIESKIKD